MWRFGASQIFARPQLIAGHNKKTKQKLNSSKVKLNFEKKIFSKPSICKIFITLKSCAERNGTQAPRKPCSDFFLSAVYRLKDVKCTSENSDEKIIRGLESSTLLTPRLYKLCKQHLERLVVVRILL